MYFLRLWTLTILLTVSSGELIEQTIRPCSPIPQSFQLVRKAVIAPKQYQAISNDTRNLLHQILHNPCLHVEYDGLKLDLASQITIYGTCNSYDRMFRFRTVYVPSYNCWQSRLTVMEAPICETNILAEDYRFLHSGIMEKSRPVNIELTQLVEGDTGADSLGRRCACNVSRDMVGFWRAKCPDDDGRETDKSWMVQPRIIVEWFLMMIGMYLLGWVLMYMAAPRLPKVDGIRGRKRQRRRKATKSVPSRRGRGWTE